ncbi:hypothetical protein Verru16b_00548 [Lacunisphaera limnophila]|uniref:Uncharacterized protein n=1 Tax=Lacunisphaera limnophila TaxID=1838286 RepID=A0A1D8ARI7_9BACT|nr:hypothetical protein Verru16b_00548 [Lacunisphaera limnophila]
MIVCCLILALLCLIVGTDQPPAPTGQPVAEAKPVRRP